MPYGFNAEISAAFDRYEAERPKRVELPPLRFEAGPYFAPGVKRGQKIECARLGEVRVVGWSEGPLPWPKGTRGRPPSLILFADLERAVRAESTVAVALAWGVSRVTVHHWREALEVGRTTSGTSARWKQNAPAIASGVNYGAIVRATHTPEAIERAAQTRNANALGKRRWSAEEIAWMGELTDAEIARRAGCDKLTVARERNRQGIAGRFVGCSAGLLRLDPAKVRARRLALGLIQREVGARLGLGERRAAQLENARSTRVKPKTLQHLAQALECETRDLQ